MNSFPVKNPDVLRVVSLNLWGFFANWKKRQTIIAENWHQIQPQVLLLQEVRNQDGVHQAYQLAELLEYPYVAIATCHSVWNNCEGIAILSKIPITEHYTKALTTSEPPRCFLSVRLEEPDCWIINTHLAVSPDKDRLNQLEQIISLKHKKMVIGGDLNSSPKEISKYAKKVGIVDPLEKQDISTWPIDKEWFGKHWQEYVGYPPIFPTDFKKLDYILHRGIECINSGALELGEEQNWASDHKIIWADYKIN